MGRNISCSYAASLVVGKAIIEAGIISYYRTSATEHNSAAGVIGTSIADDFCSGRIHFDPLWIKSVSISGRLPASN